MIDKNGRFQNHWGHTSLKLLVGDITKNEKEYKNLISPNINSLDRAVFMFLEK